MYILIFALSLTIAAVVLVVVFMEESPLYLIKKGEFDKANIIMAKIHRINNGKIQAEKLAY